MAASADMSAPHQEPPLTGIRVVEFAALGPVTRRARILHRKARFHEFLQALVGGSVDLVAGAYEHTIRMQAKGQDVRAVIEMLRGRMDDAAGCVRRPWQPR